MNPSSKKPEADLGRDLKTFEALPAKTKEAVVLKDQAEKSTGPENAALNQAIRDQSTP